MIGQILYVSPGKVGELTVHTTNRLINMLFSFTFVSSRFSPYDFLQAIFKFKFAPSYYSLYILGRFDRYTKIWLWLSATFSISTSAINCAVHAGGGHT